MTKKFYANIFRRSALALILPIFALFCLVLLFAPFWRYNAFPAEKRIAKNIEQAAYGAQYKNSDLDYCIPRPGLPVCSADFFNSSPPMTECYTPKCQWGL